MPRGLCVVLHPGGLAAVGEEEEGHASAARADFQFRTAWSGSGCPYFARVLSRSAQKQSNPPGGAGPGLNFKKYCRTPGRARGKRALGHLLVSEFHF